MIAFKDPVSKSGRLGGGRFFPFCRSLIISNVHDIFWTSSPRYLTTFSASLGILRPISDRLGVQKSKKFPLFGGTPHLGGSLSGLLKAKKSPAAYVWNDRIWSTHRETSPFVSADRYDPKGVCKYNQYDFWSYRKFFRGGWSPASHPRQTLFWVLWATKVIIKIEKCAVAHV